MAYLKSYVGTYLREEVQAEALTRNIEAFSRFLVAASFSQASVLSVSEVARELGASRKTVESHFDLLEDLLLAFRLPVFSRRAKRAMMTHPKFYFFDAGVFRALRPRGPLDATEEIEGAASRRSSRKSCAPPTTTWASGTTSLSGGRAITARSTSSSTANEVSWPSR